MHTLGVVEAGRELVGMLDLILVLLAVGVAVFVAARRQPPTPQVVPGGQPKDSQPACQRL